MKVEGEDDYAENVDDYAARMQSELANLLMPPNLKPAPASSPLRRPLSGPSRRDGHAKGRSVIRTAKSTPEATERVLGVGERSPIVSRSEKHVPRRQRRSETSASVDSSQGAHKAARYSELVATLSAKPQLRVSTARPDPLPPFELLSGPNDPSAFFDDEELRADFEAPALPPEVKRFPAVVTHRFADKSDEAARGHPFGEDPEDDLATKECPPKRVRLSELTKPPRLQGQAKRWQGVDAFTERREALVLAPRPGLPAQVLALFFTNPAYLNKLP